MCRNSSCRPKKNRPKCPTAFHTNGAVRNAVSPRSRAPSSLSVPRSLCCSTFDRVGRQKTPREASRARARLGRRQRRCRAWVSKCRSVDLRRRRPRSAPIRRIWRDGFRRSACAEWPDTREYRGGRGGVARDARGEGSDRQTGSARHVSVLAHPGRYVRFPSSSRGGGHTAGSSHSLRRAERRRRAPGFGRSRAFLLSFPSVSVIRLARSPLTAHAPSLTLYNPERRRLRDP